MVGGKHRARACLALVLAVPLAGCGGRTPAVRMDPDDQLAVCKREHERGKHQKAIPQLQDLTLNYPGTPEGMEAQYLLGESYLRMEEYELAREAFQDLVRDYPKSEWRDDAQLKVGISYFEESLPPEYDQELTHKAVEEFEVFLAEYATSPLRDEASDWLLRCREKLALKDLLNGRLYLKMGYTRAARLTFDRVLEQYPSSQSAAPAVLGIARAYVKEKKTEEAEAVLDRLMNEYPETPEALQGRDVLRELTGVSQEQG